MMSTFNLVLSTPDGNLFDGDAEMLKLRGADGDLAILSGHMPFVTSIKPGDCKILLQNGEEKHFSLKSGVLTVSKNSVTVLSSSISL